MTKEQKMKMIKAMMDEQLIENLIWSAKRQGRADANYGFFNEKTRELAEDVDMLEDELMNRLAMYSMMENELEMQKNIDERN